MKHLILFLVLSFSTIGYVHAQDEEEIIDFSYVENLPEFPGGKTAFSNYLNHSVKYSEGA